MSESQHQLVEAARQIGIFDDEAVARIASAIGQPSRDFINNLAGVVETREALWALYREANAAPCNDCESWASLSDAVPGSFVMCSCGARIRVSTRLGALLNPLGARFGCWIPVKHLGSGGRGHVYRAVDVNDRSRGAALKLLDSRVSGDEAMAQRFAREASVLGRLDHPNVVRVLDFQPSPTAFLAMELISGESITERVQRLRRLTPLEVADLARQGGAGLQAIHTLGVVHRDLKPDNLMVCDGVLKLVDFGLTKGFDASDSLHATLTKSGMAVGTPMYMSPEQCLGESLDGRADLYALGLTLYAALAGRPPYADRDAASLLRLQVTQVPPDLPEDVAPPSLMALIRRLMAKRPEDRTPSGQALVDEANAVLAELRSAASQAGKAETLDTPPPPPADDISGRNLGPAPPQQPAAGQTGPVRASAPPAAAPAAAPAKVPPRDIPPATKAGPPPAAAPPTQALPEPGPGPGESRADRRRAREARPFSWVLFLVAVACAAGFGATLYLVVFAR